MSTAPPTLDRLVPILVGLAGAVTALGHQKVGVTGFLNDSALLGTVTLMLGIALGVSGLAQWGF